MSSLDPSEEKVQVPEIHGLPPIDYLLSYYLPEREFEKAMDEWRQQFNEVLQKMEEICPEPAGKYVLAILHGNCDFFRILLEGQKIELEMAREQDELVIRIPAKKNTSEYVCACGKTVPRLRGNKIVGVLR